MPLIGNASALPVVDIGECSMVLSKLQSLITYTYLSSSTMYVQASYWYSSTNNLCHSSGDNCEWLFIPYPPETNINLNNEGNNRIYRPVLFRMAHPSYIRQSKADQHIDLFAIYYAAP